MSDIDGFKAAAAHLHVNFEDIEDIRKGWVSEAGRMAEVTAVAQQMEFVRKSTDIGPSIGLGTPGLHDFLAAHTVLVDMVKDSTAGASDTFANCIASTLQGIAQIYKEGEERNLRALAKLGVRNWTPPTKAETQADYWAWRNR